MEIKKIVDNINRGYIASDYLRYPDCAYFMDMVIDDINEVLNAKYPTFSEWEDFVKDWNKFIRDLNLPDYMLRDRFRYDAFPDKYLRSVVGVGTAVKFYGRDEEGEQVALDYQNRYQQALFMMTRDYHELVPRFFTNEFGGYIDISCIREAGPCGLHPRGVVMRGDTKVV